MDLYLYVIITTLMHIVWGINLSNSNNNYAMQMDSDITIGQGIGVGGPGFTCNNACGGRAMFGFDKFGFSSYGEDECFIMI
jgi:hypothetical protein